MMEDCRSDDAKLARFRDAHRTTVRNLFAVLVWLCTCAVCLWAQTSTQPKPSGTVQVLYAGSLGSVLEKSVGPEFEKNSGFTFQGEGQGSLGAAKMIFDGLRSPDVFISVCNLRVQRDGPRVQPE